MLGKEKLDDLRYWKLPSADPCYTYFLRRRRLDVSPNGQSQEHVINYTTASQM